MHNFQLLFTFYTKIVIVNTSSIIEFQWKTVGDDFRLFFAVKKVKPNWPSPCGDISHRPTSFSWNLILFGIFEFRAKHLANNSRDIPKNIFAANSTPRAVVKDFQPSMGAADCAFIVDEANWQFSFNCEMEIEEERKVGEEGKEGFGRRKEEVPE